MGAEFGPTWTRAGVEDADSDSEVPAPCDSRARGASPETVIV